MVTFTRIPYATAAQRARLQDGIVYSGVAFLLLMAAFVVIRLIIGRQMLSQPLQWRSALDVELRFSPLPRSSFQLPESRRTC